MLRETESNFLNTLTVSKRGLVKTATSQLPGDRERVQKVLKKFMGCLDLPENVVDSFLQRAKLDMSPDSVNQDFFIILKKMRKETDNLHLSTAKSLRRTGIFKVAGRDVYEDLETGDFWKISEDKKHVMRLFNENDEGISDKKASIENKEVEAGKENGPANSQQDSSSKGQNRERMRKRVRQPGSSPNCPKTSSKELREKVLQYFSDKDSKFDDESIHAFAEQQEIEPDELEEEIYSILRDFLGAGKFVEAKSDIKIDPEQLKLGIEVEKEHTRCPQIAERIAKDHLTEIDDYYTRLNKMEKEAKNKNAGKQKGPGIPDGTGPMRNSPQCQFNKNVVEEQEKGQGDKTRMRKRLRGQPK